MAALGRGVILLLGVAIARAQTAGPSSEPPLTDRERAMLERIQKLEERLAALESKSGAAAPKADSGAVTPLPPPRPVAEAALAPDPPGPNTNTPAPNTPAVKPATPPQASGQLPPGQESASWPSGEPTGYAEPVIWGEWNPGKGYKVAQTERGDLFLSGYMVARYLNQLPPHENEPDHLGQLIPVQARQDFQFHRVMLYTTGWFLDPKFQFFTFVWTVNDTTQVAVGGALSYNFNDHFNVGMGLNPLPISRSVQGNHPYWTSYDRVMADEFFRPFFTQGLFGSGEIVPGLYYKWMTGNNLSTLGVKATQLDRDLNFGGSLTWMPTTHEFGPRGGFGDFEDHEKLATRFGVGWGFSREDRQANENDPNNNTTIRLADSLNVFDPGTFAPGVTVQKVTYHLLAADAGMKFHGFWLQGEGYYRLLDNFLATGGPMPVGTVRDTGFYVQTSYMVVPKTVELYVATSYVFSNYGRPKEFIAGGNWYFARNRNTRINLQLINVDHSPVNSTFGFYTGLLTGQVLALGVTALY